MLDGMRGLGALLVFVTHFTVLEGVNQHHWWGRLTPQVGDVGLAVLFMVSAFLLYRPWASMSRGGPDAPSVRSFARNRLLRIIPGYWFALTVLAIYPGLPGMFNSHFWVHYGFIQVYSNSWAFGGLKQTWTLCVEMSFYLLLPIFALWVTRGPRRADTPGRREAPVIIAAFAAGIGVNIWVFAIHSHWLVALQTILGYADDIAIGLTLAVISSRLELGMRVPRPLTWLAQHAVITWTAAWGVFASVCVAAHFSGALAYPPDFTLGTWIIRHLAIAVTAGMLMLPMTLDRTNVSSLVGRLLASAPAAWLGLVSYGFYLYHLPILEWAKQHVQTQRIAPFLAITLIASLLAAAASYYWIERPFHRLKAGRKAPARKAATVHPN
jgi:peptidoglycan/LPS O-acetylase OafA/YrhL